MEKKINEVNSTLIEFWNSVFALSDEQREELRREGGEDWKQLAPSRKLFLAAASLSDCTRVLDYGCGSGWAAITAAKSGCKKITAVDTSENAIEALRILAQQHDVCSQINALAICPDWLKSVENETYDGLICSNVLDVIPAEIAAEMVEQFARILKPKGRAVIGLNYYISVEAAAERKMEMSSDGQLYVNGILRMVSRTDGQWSELFEKHFDIERLDHFAWPNEQKETRRLFMMRRKQV